MRILSWNLLRQVGAGVDDVAALIAATRPDLVLMQEATAEIDALPARIGGNYSRAPLPQRIHGLAAWSPFPLPAPEILPLPHGKAKRAGYPRVAQVLRFEKIEIVNVHLSHGQLMLRRQLERIAGAVDGRAAVIGDFNAVGNTAFFGFRDVGPRQPTHFAKGVLPFRLDRCLVRGLACTGAEALRRGKSDHRPILVDLAPAKGRHGEHGQGKHGEGEHEQPVEEYVARYDVFNDMLNDVFSRRRWREQIMPRIREFIKAQAA